MRSRASLRGSSLPAGPNSWLTGTARQTHTGQRLVRRCGRVDGSNLPSVASSSPSSSAISSLSGAAASSSNEPTSRWGRLRWAFEPKVLENGSVSTMCGRCSTKAAGQQREKRRRSPGTSDETHLALHALALVLEQAHRQLVALEQDRVGVLDVGRERGAEVVEGRLRDDTRVA